MGNPKLKQSGLVVILVIVIVVVGVIVEISDIFAETTLVWILLFVVAGVLASKWQNLREEAEVERRDEIYRRQNELGPAMCQWLVQEGIDPFDNHIDKILQKYNAWGENVCKNLLQKNIGIGMTEEMVLYSLGNPTTIDSREITARSEKFRWVYGIPRKGASYIWFKNGEVAKIKV